MNNATVDLAISECISEGVARDENETKMLDEFERRRRNGETLSINEVDKLLDLWDRL